MSYMSVYGDFRDNQPDKLARLVLSDIPYNIGEDYGPVSDSLPLGEYLLMVKQFSEWAAWNTEDDAWLAVVHQPDFFFRHGAACFLDHWEYVRSVPWCYNSNIGHSDNFWSRSHRDIAFFKKGKPWFDPKADPEPYQNPNDRRVKALVEAGSPGRAPYDWWVFNLQKNVGADHQGYANQLPTPLVRRIVLSMTQPGETVADPFGGTGTVAKVASSLNRNGWTCDLNPDAPCLKALTIEGEGTRCRLPVRPGVTGNP